MNKKAITTIIIFAAVIILGIVGYFMFSNNKTNEQPTAEETETEIETTTDDDPNDDNAVVLYFSATGNTAKVAREIADDEDLKAIEIVPEEEYTEEDLDWNNDGSRTSVEMNDASVRPALKSPIDISSYDTIYLGYPIWWGKAPRIIFTLLDQSDFSGKTIIPFCTSGSSSISQSETELKDYLPDATWLSGKCFSSSASSDEVENWLEKLN